MILYKLSGIETQVKVSAILLSNNLVQLLPVGIQNLFFRARLIGASAAIIFVQRARATGGLRMIVARHQTPCNLVPV